MLRRTPRAMVLVWLLAAAGGVAFQLLLNPERAGLTFLETLLPLAVLVLMGSAAAPVFAPLGAGTKRVLLVALGLMLFGQFVQESSLTYPAVHWGMYADTPPREFLVLEYEVHTRSGAVRPLDPLTAFPSLNSFRLSYLLQNLATDSAKPGADPELAGLWQNMLLAVGEQLNRTGGADPVTSIEVFARRLDSETWRPGQSPPPRDSLLRVEIP